jgi:hypothetical protein
VDDASWWPLDDKPLSQQPVPKKNLAACDQGAGGPALGFIRA